MDGEAGWWTTSGNIGLPPLARAMGVGRQQQQLIVFTSKYKQDLCITIGDTVVDHKLRCHCVNTCHMREHACVSSRGVQSTELVSLYIGYWTLNNYYYYYCSSQVKDLGVIFDRVLSLRQQVSYTSRTCRFHLRSISRIRKYIPQDISIVLIKSLVMSSLDYSNGLLYGLPKCTVSGLQAVQNSAARIVTQERLRDHDSMSRALMELHWLPVDKRIEYKLLLYTYKALHGLTPGYLCKLVVPYEPRRVLRSAESNLLTVPPGKPGKYGSRSFVRASANLWNSLRGERAAWLKNSP